MISWILYVTVLNLYLSAAVLSFKINFVITENIYNEWSLQILSNPRFRDISGVGSDIYGYLYGEFITNLFDEMDRLEFISIYSFILYIIILF